jgi:hypothetical protein
MELGSVTFKLKRIGFFCFPGPIKHSTHTRNHLDFRNSKLAQIALGSPRVQTKKNANITKIASPGHPVPPAQITA